MININNLCDEIISNTEKQNEIYLKMKEDYDYFEKNCYGKLNNKILSKLLDMSLDDQYLQEILSLVLYFCDKNSISDENFNKLIHYPGKIKKTYLIALSHCELSLYQLNYLNNKNISTEAFCQMLYIIFMNTCFTENDLLYFLKTSKFNYDVFSLQVETLLKEKNTINYEKIEVLKNFLKDKKL